jgi:hypothetical protein
VIGIHCINNCKSNYDDQDGPETSLLIGDKLTYWRQAYLLETSLLIGAKLTYWRQAYLLETSLLIGAKLTYWRQAYHDFSSCSGL